MPTRYILAGALDIQSWVERWGYGIHEELEVAYETKLLGVIIRSDCKWSSNTEYMTKKAKSKLWFLRRLKYLGASDNTLIDLFKLHLRSTLELAVPLWTGSITKKEINSIERLLEH